MTPEFTIRTEAIGDGVLLLEAMKRMGLPEIVDGNLGKHWLHQGMTRGWVATIWLAHILTQGDHRKVVVREWVEEMKETLERVTGQRIRETDFTDDRLTLVLRDLSRTSGWMTIEREMASRTVKVYNLKAKRIRVDATTVSGYHEGGEGGLWQFGHSKDAPGLMQVKVMGASLDPLGMPLVTEVVSGEKADDRLYGPVIRQVVRILEQDEMLFVGDSKLSSLGNRGQVVGLKQWYLTPPALVGHTRREVANWIEQALKEKNLTPVTRVNAEGKVIELGWGYETSRECQVRLGGMDLEWIERVVVVYTHEAAEAQVRGVEQRLATATAKLQALTPPRARAVRQFTTEADVVAAAEAIVRQHRVEGLLTYSFERQVETQEKLLGRGRAGINRPTHTVERVRYQITSVSRSEAAINAHCDTLGWRVYLTNAPLAQLSLQDVVLTYRDQWLIERGFHRLKGIPLSLNPVFVHRDDQVTGLIHLLSLALRVLSLIEFTVRRALALSSQSLVGLHLENPKKPSSHPTAERLLWAFRRLTLTIVSFPDRVARHLTPLTPLQIQILELLGFPPSIYSSLALDSP